MCFDTVQPSLAHAYASALTNDQVQMLFDFVGKVRVFTQAVLVCVWTVHAEPLRSVQLTGKQGFFHRNQRLSDDEPISLKSI